MTDPAPPGPPVALRARRLLEHADKWSLPLRVVSNIGKLPTIWAVGTAAGGVLVAAAATVWPGLPILAQIMIGAGGLMLIAKGSRFAAVRVRRRLMAANRMPVSIEVGELVRVRTASEPAKPANGWAFVLQGVRITNQSPYDRVSLGLTLLLSPAGSIDGYPRYLAQQYKAGTATTWQQTPYDFQVPVEIPPQSTWAGAVSFLLEDAEINEYIGDIADFEDRAATLDVRIAHTLRSGRSCTDARASRAHERIN